MGCECGEDLRAVGPIYSGSNRSGLHPLILIASVSHGAWVANANSGVTHIDSNGTVLSNPQCCNGAAAVAIDAAGYVWADDYDVSGLHWIAPDGTIQTLVGGGQNGGLGAPNGYVGGISVDAAQNVWVALSSSNGFAGIVGDAEYQPAGTAL